MGESEQDIDQSKPRGWRLGSKSQISFIGVVFTSKMKNDAPVLNYYLKHVPEGDKYALFIMSKDEFHIKSGSYHLEISELKLSLAERDVDISDIIVYTVTDGVLNLEPVIVGTEMIDENPEWFRSRQNYFSSWAPAPIKHGHCFSPEKWQQEYECTFSTKSNS